jgi:hypothetical protein
MKKLFPVSSHRYYLAVTMAALLGFLVACSDGSDSSNQGAKIVLLELLPSSTRGFLQVSSDLEEGDAQWLQELDDAEAPWRHIPLDILRYYSDPLDLVRSAQRWILAQATVAGDEYILLADIDKSTGDALLDNVETGSGGEYRGFSLLLITDNGLYVVRLNANTWVTAPKSSLEQVIDVHVGKAPGIDQSAIAGYLDSIDDARPLNFTYGLAGLYGEVPVPGSGDSSLNTASIVRAAFNIQGGILDGSMQFVAPNATGFTERLLGLLPEGSPAIIDAAEDTINIDLTGLSATDDLRPLLKSLYIGMNGVDYAEAVSQGGNPPWLKFDVGQNPNSLFINFEFSGEASRHAFEAEHLPVGFTLAPLRILDTDEPRYFFVVNFYQSSGGLVEGARAEWSVFIHDPETSVPRFLVIQAAAATFTADSVNLLVPPEPVFHLLEPAAIVSYVGVEDKESGTVEEYFSSRINWPQPPETNVLLDREFVAANDYIFWGNAVADRGLYNSSVHNRPVASIAPSQISMVDNSRWTAYINPEPVHTLVYRNLLEIAISPWWNLDEDYLDVTEAYRQELIDFKNGFYSPLVLIAAELAMRGGRSTLTPTTTGESTATAHYHFVIEDPEALLASVGAQGKFTPVAISLDDKGSPGFYLTLAVSMREDDPCGLRAAWSTYILNEKNRPRTLQFDGFSSDACLDPVALLGLPAVVQQAVEGKQLKTRISSPLSRFEATLDLSRSAEVVPGQDWVEAGDQVCSMNGICDYTFYDGQTLVHPAQRIDFGGITVEEIATPWDDFIDTEPAEVTVRQFPAIRGINRWRDVPPFGTQ